MKYSRGDIVDFIGTRHYRTHNGNVYFSVKPGVAKITAIMNNSAHPYHLEAEPNGGSNVNGWVKEEDIKQIHQETVLKVVSFAKSTGVKIAFAEKTELGINIETTPWSNQNWIGVFRCKNPKDAEKIAHMAEISVAKQSFYNIDLYESTFVEICLDAANIAVPEFITTTSLISSGLFYHFKDAEYCEKADYLRRGDILFGGINGGAIVLSNGKKSNEIAQEKIVPSQKENIEKPIIKSIKMSSEPEVITAKDQPVEKDYSLSGVYTTIVPTRIKNTADLKSGVLVQIPKGSLVRNYGYFSDVEGTKWLYVQTKYKNTIYNGFISERCVIKK